jgi:putative ABC transport system permease protein
VQRPARRGQQVEQMLAAFQFNLAALSYVALLVGLFLVYNTVATSVIARRDEIGMLRALGAGRTTVLALFLGEAAALAALGCLAGIPLGWALARGAVGLTSATVTTLYAAHASGVPALTLAEVGLAIGIGVPLALLAAAAPALEAAGVSPLRAVRGGADDSGGSPVQWRWTVGGVGCLLVSAACSQAGPVGGLPIFGFLSAVLIVFGLAALVPAVLAGLARATRASMLRVLGVEGRLAHANLAGAIRRLSVSVAALAVSLAMLVAIAVMIGSFRETVIYWVAQTLRADLYVATARRSNLDAQATISPSLEQAIAGDPDVGGVDRFRALSVTFRDRLIVLGSGDFRVLLDHGALVFKAPADGPAALASAIGRDAIVVSESLSLRFGVNVGDHIEVPTPSGPHPFLVSAVYFDYSTDRGVVVMDRATFVRHYGDQRPTSLSVYLRPGSNAEAVRARLMAQLAPSHRLFIHTNTTLRTEVLRIFDATFAITYGLEAIAIVVAVLGVAGTLVTLILERRRELATLRLVGADLGQIRRMIVIEAGMLGAVSQALGLVAGLALSVVLIYVINVQSFGWTIQFHLPGAFLLQAMAVVLAATTLAGVYPARLAAGFRPADEISTE